MKWVALVVFVSIFSSFAGAVSVENLTHSDPYSTYFAVVSPKDSIHIDDYNVSSYSLLKLKVYNRLSAIEMDSTNHSFSSGELSFNVSRYNITKLMGNMSTLYLGYIQSLNSTAKIIVGKSSFDSRILNVYDIGIVNGFLKYKNKVGVYPFNSAIVSFTFDGERIIAVLGNAVEGEVAGLRFLKKHLDEFVYLDDSAYLDDLDALSVYDFMHNEENDEWYNTDTYEFKSIVNKSLFGKVEEDVIDVKSKDGVLLRAVEISPLNTQKFISYTHNVTLPVVLARGLWSDLYTWKDFGVELADSGREVFLIEITGGPGQDCSECVNYNFSDLIDSYWPALIGTVQAISGSSKLQYAGHSNGARTGISSLELYNEIGVLDAGSYWNGTKWVNVSMTPHPIDTYIAMGMPGAFEGGNSLFGDIVKDNYVEIMENLSNRNITHIKFWDVFDAYFGFVLPHREKNTISLNLLDEYFRWISNSTDKQPKANFNISKLTIISGNRFKDDDGIVILNDNIFLYNTSKADKTEFYCLYLMHSSMGENGQTQYIIKKTLNNESLTNFKKMQYSYMER